MFRIIMHGLLARKFRLFATALAVTLGVAFMAGTLVLTDTLGQTFNDLSAGVYKGTDAEVRAASAFNGPQFTGAQRPFVDASLTSTLSRVPGVAATEERPGSGSPGQWSADAGRQLEPGGRAQPVAAAGRACPAVRRPGGDRQEERSGRPPPGR